METVTQYMDNKGELEAQIQRLESERSSLMGDISSLKERLSVLELGKQAKSLNGEVEALRVEKVVLEEKIASYNDVDSSSAEGYQV